MNLGEPCAEAEQQPIDRNETAFDLMRDTIRGTQRHSEAIRGHPRPSEAIRGNQRQSAHLLEECFLVEALQRIPPIKWVIIIGGEEGELCVGERLDEFDWCGEAAEDGW